MQDLEAPSARMPFALPPCLRPPLAPVHIAVRGPPCVQAAGKSEKSSGKTGAASTSVVVPKKDENDPHAQILIAMRWVPHLVDDEM